MASVLTVDANVRVEPDCTAEGHGRALPDWNQSQGTREHIPGFGTNHKGLESIFQGLEPITGD
eukprot:1022718-Pyramimonas_sp.AAC.1